MHSGSIDKSAANEILVLPARVRFSVDEGESVFLAARRNGIRWPTRCEGNAACRLCFFECDAEQPLSPIEPVEAEALRSLPRPAHPGELIRLACQTRLLGDAVVSRVGVRPMAPPVVRADPDAGDPNDGAGATTR